MAFNNIDQNVPADTAFIGDGAAEIRGVKQALNTTFPNVQGEISKPQDYNTPGTTQPSAADFTALFADIDSIVNATANSNDIPQGTISMWFGDPTTIGTTLSSKGWYLCNGQTAPNGFKTPDLTDKFIKAWDGTNNVRNGDGTVVTGGGNASAEVETTVPYEAAGSVTPKALVTDYTLTMGADDIPAHYHNFVYDNASGNNQTVNPLTPNNYLAVFGDKDNPQYELRAPEESVPPSAQPTLGRTSNLGNDATFEEIIDTGATANEFSHIHKVTLGDLEPTHAVLAFICYCGTV